MSETPIEQTVFAKIISGELASEKVFENDNFLAIKDIQPLAPEHILLLPKEPIRDISQVNPEHRELLGEMLLVATEIARSRGLEDGGYRLALNSGDDAGLMVPYLHLHIIGGKKLGPPA